ncbi:tyrosine-type recombinase/integrase [Paenibacillus sp. 2TAB19]|uniref:tyrosine-type recombinase/integrase n=1 Tax=Paenibacillus sp. 2TAB19 TaxID=3233003 RepID=UPI003F9C4B70
MASYTKRGKTWQYTISRMIKGKSDPIRKGGFLTKKEAQVAAAEIEGKLRKGENPQLKAKEVLFDEYFENWLKLYKPDIGSNTLARYENTLKTIQEHFPSSPIQEITKRQYQAILNAYGATRTKETARKFNTHVRACVREAIDEGLIIVDFTRGVKLSGALPSKTSEEKHLSFFESKRLAKELVTHLSTISHYLILLALTSGARFGELVGLTKKDFNFKTNELMITKTWGYTNKMHTGFGPTKNPQSVRTIKIDEDTMRIFKEWFKRLPDNFHGLVFYSASSKYKVISNNAVNKSLEIMLTNLNIEPVSIHGMRHTHASVLLYKGVSIYYISERLGHGDIETTMANYAHIIKELRTKDEKTTIEVFSNILN